MSTIRRRTVAGTMNAGVIVAFTIGLIAIIGIATYVTVARRPAAVTHVAANDWERQKAQECQGVMARLSMDDQNRLISMYGLPGAPSRIANLYRTLQASQ